MEAKINALICRYFEKDVKIHWLSQAIRASAVSIDDSFEGDLREIISNYFRNRRLVPPSSCLSNVMSQDISAPSSHSESSTETSSSSSSAPSQPVPQKLHSPVKVHHQHTASPLAKSTPGLKKEKKAISDHNFSDEQSTKLMVVNTDTASPIDDKSNSKTTPRKRTAASAGLNTSAKKAKGSSTSPKKAKRDAENLTPKEKRKRLEKRILLSSGLILWPTLLLGNLFKKNSMEEVNPMGWSVQSKREAVLRLLKKMSKKGSINRAYNDHLKTDLYIKHTNMSEQKLAYYDISHAKYGDAVLRPTARLPLSGIQACIEVFPDAKAKLAEIAASERRKPKISQN